MQTKVNMKKKTTIHLHAAMSSVMAALALMLLSFRAS